MGTVPKFRTSAVHGACGAPLAMVRSTLLSPKQELKIARSIERWGKVKSMHVYSPEVHSLHYCSEEGCPGNSTRMVNRDGNAAGGNIMQRFITMTMGVPPPPYLDQALLKGEGRVKPPTSMWLTR